MLRRVEQLVSGGELVYGECGYLQGIVHFNVWGVWEAKDYCDEKTYWTTREEAIASFEM